MRSSPWVIELDREESRSRLQYLIGTPQLAVFQLQDPKQLTLISRHTDPATTVDLKAALAGADLAVLVQPHDEIVGSGTLGRADRILDTRRVLRGDNVESL